MPAPALLAPLLGLGKAALGAGAKIGGGLAKLPGAFAQIGQSAVNPLLGSSLPPIGAAGTPPVSTVAPPAVPPIRPKTRGFVAPEVNSGTFNGFNPSGLPFTPQGGFTPDSQVRSSEDAISLNQRIIPNNFAPPPVNAGLDPTQQFTPNNFNRRQGGIV